MGIHSVSTNKNSGPTILGLICIYCIILPDYTVQILVKSVKMDLTMQIAYKVQRFKNPSGDHVLVTSCISCPSLVQFKDLASDNFFKKVQFLHESDLKNTRILNLPSPGEFNTQIFSP